MKKLLLFFIFCAASSFAYPRLMTGTYTMNGSNNKWGGNGYSGEVTIQPQGENYQVFWRIGPSNQTQVGVGILCNDVLSVAFLDTTKNSWGVVSFHLVADGELEGRWTTLNSTSQKREHLVWKRY